jgi:hypothetical protein
MEPLPSPPSPPGPSSNGMSQLLSETIGRIFHEEKTFLETVRERRKLRQQRIYQLFQGFRLTSREQQSTAQGEGQREQGEGGQYSGQQEEERFQEEIQRILNHDNSDDDEDDEEEEGEGEGDREEQGMCGSEGGEESFKRPNEDECQKRESEGMSKSESMTSQEIDDVRVLKSPSRQGRV